MELETISSKPSIFEIMYSAKINKRIAAARRGKLNGELSASGREATFVCGTFVEFDLSIDETVGIIKDATFRTNGCGFAVAFADHISEVIKGAKLIELHALHDIEQTSRRVFGKPSVERAHCLETCIAALQKALADYRLRQVHSWNGDDALICSCFGVSEKTIESAIDTEGLLTVEAVGENCNAGTGCGSCQPLVQEILDSYHVE